MRISLLNHTDKCSHSELSSMCIAYTCERNASAEEAAEEKMFPVNFSSAQFFFFAAVCLFCSCVRCMRLCLYARLSKAIQRQYKKFCCKANEHGKNAVPLAMRKKNQQQRPFVCSTHRHTRTQSRVQKSRKMRDGNSRTHTDRHSMELKKLEKLLQRKNTCVFTFDRWKKGKKKMITTK